MIMVKYYGPMQELTGMAAEELEASQVTEVINQIRKKYGKKVAEDAEQCFIMVNGKNAALLKGFRTRLKSGDTVQILPVTGGG